MEKETKRSSATLLETYQMHLLSRCGVSAGTCALYIRYGRNFLQAKYGGDTVALADLRPTDMISFVTDCCTRYKPETSKAAANALRSFLRFLQLEGLCGPNLVQAVPTIATWRLSSLPATLSDGQLRELLTSFDRSTAIGMRNYAMTVCLSELGLRAGEVALLSLDDIDWRSGTLRVPKGKTRRENILPLPTKIARAVSAYLRRSRPSSSQRQVFVRHKVPIGEPISGGAIGAVLSRAFKRAGIDAPSKGSHILRHTAATRMIRQGATLKEIADVLRHKSIDTTAIYAKVDLKMLSEVAMPWPEVG